MGHYCHFCGEKLMGGLVPTCCKNIECICDGCRDNVVNNRMSKELSTYISKNIQIKDKEAKFPITEELLEWLQKVPTCPECGADWTNMEFTYY